MLQQVALLNQGLRLPCVFRRDRSRISIDSRAVTAMRGRWWFSFGGRQLHSTKLREVDCQLSRGYSEGKMLGHIPLEHSALEISQSIQQSAPSIAQCAGGSNSSQGSNPIRRLLSQNHGSLSFQLNPAFLVILPHVSPEGPEGHEAGDDEGWRDQYGYRKM